MQIKNRKKKLLFFFLTFFLFNFSINAEEFNITAKEILIDKENSILIGTGSVVAVDSEGNIIKADKITYKKSKEFLLAEGNVKINDLEGNIITSDKASFDKINESIITYSNTELFLNGGYKLNTKNALYDFKKKVLSSDYKSTITDDDGNYIEISMFRYHLKNNLFSSVGKIKIIDIKKNKYYFKELHIDTKKKEMIGSDVSIILDQKNFGMGENSDPRFVANDIFMTTNRTDLSKGVFTVCQMRDEKCPPWTLKAKKISHDKIKKTIYYENATLKLYDIPIFYFPKFFHPDPTVKRQSGFLNPLFTNTSNLGTGIATPYFWAISDDKDITFTPRGYTKENALFLNEYRQAFRNGFLTLDTSYTPGYSNTSNTKTKGSRNHIFTELDLNFNQREERQSSLHLKVQRTSNDTYLKKHDINTALVDSDITNLENEIGYNFSNDNSFFDVSASSYENLDVKKKSDKYEYILPNVTYGKTFFTESFGVLDFTSNALYNKYETNKNKTFLTNNVIWKPGSYITKNGFLNSFEAMARNTNYQARKTKEFKDIGTVNEINSVLKYKSSLPLTKNKANQLNYFTPNFMLRYAPGHMRDLSEKDVFLNYTNLYSMNKTSEIESGLSAILGFDYKINEKISNSKFREKLLISLGQVFSNSENKDIPSKSSLDQKMSDIVGEIKYNFSEIGKIDYKFTLDHNLNDLNYNEVSTELNFGKIQFNLDYLEQQNHIGLEHYASSGISLNFNDSNKLSFSTKKNFKTESTELYNLSYQYTLDCLTAGLSYRREFYQDDDLEKDDSLLFTITFVPFSKLSAPVRD